MLIFYIAPVAQLCSPNWATSFCSEELARLAQIRAEKRRQEYIAGHQLLRLAAQHSLGTNLPPQDWQQLPNAAPSLIARPDVLTSISHSKGWVAAAVLRLIQTEQDGCMESPKLGVDIEIERERKNLVQLATYSFGEQWLANNKHHLLPAFFQRWTLCEALVKGSNIPLGTRLLRGQKFVADTPLEQGLSEAKTQTEITTSSENEGAPWLNHFRFSLATTEAPCVLHLSLCSPVKRSMQGFYWQAEQFEPMTTSTPNCYRAALT